MLVKETEENTKTDKLTKKYLNFIKMIDITEL
jgi:hypothetical protein